MEPDGIGSTCRHQQIYDHRPVQLVRQSRDPITPTWFGPDVQPSQSRGVGPNAGQLSSTRQRSAECRGRQQGGELEERDFTYEVSADGTGVIWSGPGGTTVMYRFVLVDSKRELYLIDMRSGNVRARIAKRQ